LKVDGLSGRFPQPLADRSSAMRPSVAEALRRGFAVLGTDLGTERGEIGANERDVVKQAGRRNAVDLNI
jgi:hypothetical protein